MGAEGACSVSSCAADGSCAKTGALAESLNLAGTGCYTEFSTAESRQVGTCGTAATCVANAAATEAPAVVTTSSTLAPTTTTCGDANSSVVTWGGSQEVAKPILVDVQPWHRLVQDVLMTGQLVLEGGCNSRQLLLDNRMQTAVQTALHSYFLGATGFSNAELLVILLYPTKVGDIPPFSTPGQMEVRFAISKANCLRLERETLLAAASDTARMLQTFRHDIYLEWVRSIQVQAVKATETVVRSGATAAADEDDSNRGPLIIVAFTFVMLVFAVAGGGFYYYRREYMSANLTDVSAEKATSKSDTGKPVSRNPRSGLLFRSAPSATAESFFIARMPFNTDKNRFNEFLPYDHSRVVLKEQEGVNGSDYINASVVPGMNGTTYIASQAPMDNTTEDFWRMVCENDCTTIAMLMLPTDGSSTPVCAQYWPHAEGNTLEFGDFTIKTTSVETKDSFITRSLTVSVASEPKLEAAAALSGKQMKVSHSMFLGFPTNAMPHDTKPFRDYWAKIQQLAAAKSTMVVHDSNGCGPTGIFICMDMAMATFNKQKYADLYDILVSVRHYRPRLVESRAQYSFLHRAFLDHASRLAIFSRVDNKDYATFIEQFAVPEKMKDFDLGCPGRSILKLGKFEMKRGPATQKNAGSGTTLTTGDWTPVIIAVSTDLVILTVVVDETEVILEDYKDRAKTTARDSRSGDKLTFELVLNAKVLLKAPDAETKNVWLSFLKQQENYQPTESLSGARLTKAKGLSRADALNILGCSDPQTTSGAKKLREEYDQIPLVMYGGPGTAIDAGNIYALPEGDDSARTAVNPTYASLYPNTAASPSSMASMSPMKMPPDYYTTTHNPLNAGVHMDEKFMRYNPKLNPSNPSTSSLQSGYSSNMMMTPMPNSPPPMMSPSSQPHHMVFRDLEMNAIKVTEESIATKLEELTRSIEHAERMQQYADGQAGAFTLANLQKEYKPPSASGLQDDNSMVLTEQARQELSMLSPADFRARQSSPMPMSPRQPGMDDDGLLAFPGADTAEAPVPLSAQNTAEGALLRKFSTQNHTPNPGAMQRNQAMHSFTDSVAFKKSPRRTLAMAGFATKALKDRLWQLFHEADQTDVETLTSHRGCLNQEELSQPMTAKELIDLLKDADVLHTILAAGNGNELSPTELLQALNKKPGDKVNLSEFLELLQPSNTAGSPPKKPVHDGHTPPKPMVAQQAPRFNVKLNLKIRASLVDLAKAGPDAEKHITLQSFKYMLKDMQPQLFELMDGDAAGEAALEKGLLQIKADSITSGDSLQQLFFDIFDNETKRDERSARNLAPPPISITSHSPGQSEDGKTQKMLDIAASLNQQDGDWAQALAPRVRKSTAMLSANGYQTIKDNPLSPKYVLKIRPSVPANILVRLKEQANHQSGDPGAFNVTMGAKRRMTRHPTVNSCPCVLCVL